MAIASNHRGWLFSPAPGILAAVYNGAKPQATAHGANTALEGVLLGTPVNPALAVDSIVISNMVASGDVLIVANRGGNSENYLFADSSAGALYLYAPNGAITLTPTTDVVFANGTGIIVGATAQVTVSTGDGATNLVAEVQVLGTTQADSTVLIGCFSATDATPPMLAFLKSGHATIGSNTAVASGERLGDIVWFGADGTDFESPAAAIRGEVDAAVGTGDMPGRVVFLATTDTGETLAEVFRYNSLAITVADDKLLRLGTTGDGVLVNVAAGLAGNTLLASVLVGTPVTPTIAANSTVLSNVTANGDILIAANLGGNSQAWLWIDSSASLMTLYAAGVSEAEFSATGVVFNEGSADRDFRIESNDNANMFVLDGGDNTIGIGGAAVAGNVVTITGAAVAATGRILKLSATLAAGALTDGYGAFEVDVTFSGSPTNHVAAASAWANVTGGTVPVGNYVCARNDGIYETGATITNAKMIFGARMQYIAAQADALKFPWSINTNNTAITALIDVNNFSDLGTVANAGATAATLVPIARNAAGTLKYVLLYDLA